MQQDEPGTSVRPDTAATLWRTSISMILPVSGAMLRQRLNWLVGCQTFNSNVIPANNRLGESPFSLDDFEFSPMALLDGPHEPLFTPLLNLQQPQQPVCTAAAISAAATASSRSRGIKQPQQPVASQPQYQQPQQPVAAQQQYPAAATTGCAAAAVSAATTASCATTAGYPASSAVDA